MFRHFRCLEVQLILTYCSTAKLVYRIDKHRICRVFRCLGPEVLDQSESYLHRYAISCMKHNVQPRQQVAWSQQELCFTRPWTNSSFKYVMKCLEKWSIVPFDMHRRYFMHFWFVWHIILPAKDGQKSFSCHMNWACIASTHGSHKIGSVDPCLRLAI